jgi:hypothetical protein
MGYDAEGRKTAARLVIDAMKLTDEGINQSMRLAAEWTSPDKPSEPKIDITPADIEALKKAGLDAMELTELGLISGPNSKQLRIAVLYEIINGGPSPDAGSGGAQRGGGGHSR